MRTLQDGTEMHTLDIRRIDGALETDCISAITGAYTLRCGTVFARCPPQVFEAEKGRKQPLKASDGCGTHQMIALPASPQGY